MSHPELENQAIALCTFLLKVHVFLNGHYWTCGGTRSAY